MEVQAIEAESGFGKMNPGASADDRGGAVEDGREGRTIRRGLEDGSDDYRQRLQGYDDKPREARADPTSRVYLEGRFG